MKPLNTGWVHLIILSEAKYDLMGRRQRGRNPIVTRDFESEVLRYIAGRKLQVIYGPSPEARLRQGLSDGITVAAIYSASLMSEVIQLEP